jgi:hypothetical protein
MFYGEHIARTNESMYRGLAVAALSALILMQEGHPSLGSGWTIDRNGTDDPQQLVTDCKSKVHGPGGHAGSQQLDTGLFAHSKYKVLSESELYRLDQTLGLALDEPFSLGILETPSSVTLTTSEGDSLVLPANGRKVKESVNGAGDVESRAYWVGSHLVIERKVSGGGAVTNEFFLSQDSTQLYVVVGFDGKCGQFKFRRIYSKAPQ